MKKILKIITAIFCLTALFTVGCLFCACNLFEKLSEEQKTIICNEFFEQNYAEKAKQDYDRYDPEKVEFIDYFGTYKNSVVFTLCDYADTQMQWSCVEVNLYVDGIYIGSPLKPGDHFYIYTGYDDDFQNGTVFTLEEGYEKGYITKINLSQIADRVASR